MGAPGARKSAASVPRGYEGLDRRHARDRHRRLVEGRAEPLDDALRARIISGHDELAAEGLRILCIGIRRLQEPPDLRDMELLTGG